MNKIIRERKYISFGTWMFISAVILAACALFIIYLRESGVVDHVK